jgi:hypothetical protein
MVFVDIPGLSHLSGCCRALVQLHEPVLGAELHCRCGAVYDGVRVPDDAPAHIVSCGPLKRDTRPKYGWRQR